MRAREHRCEHATGEREQRDDGIQRRDHSGARVAAQRKRFEQGEGGALVPFMCVDKDPAELQSFDQLAQEANAIGQPWGMVFAHSGSLQPRHPSQVYQFLLEGLLLFVLLWLYARRERKQGQVAAAFLVGYGSFRFIAEYFREPDSFLGLLSLGMSMGQWLCVPMVAAGIALWVWAQRQPVAARR